MILLRKFDDICGKDKDCFYNFRYKKDYGDVIEWCHVCHRIIYCSRGNRYCLCSLCKCTIEENEGKTTEI